MFCMYATNYLMMSTAHDLPGQNTHGKDMLAWS